MVRCLVRIDWRCDRIWRHRVHVSVSNMAKGLSGKRTVQEGNAGGKSTLRRFHFVYKQYLLMKNHEKWKHSSFHVQSVMSHLATLPHFPTWWPWPLHPHTKFCVHVSNSTHVYESDSITSTADTGDKNIEGLQWNSVYRRKWNQLV